MREEEREERLTLFTLAAEVSMQVFRLQYVDHDKVFEFHTNHRDKLVEFHTNTRAKLVQFHTSTRARPPSTASKGMNTDTYKTFPRVIATVATFP